MRRLATFIALALGACAAPEPPRFAPVAPMVVAAGTPVTIANPGFEGRADENGVAEGWTAFWHAGEKSYDFALDPAVRRGGAHSMRIRNVGPEPFGALTQSLPAAAMRGRTVQFAGWLRIEGVTGEGAMLTLRALASGAIAAHKFMDDPPAARTRDWQRYTIALAVPPNADTVDFGAMLLGPGTLWLDDVELVVLP
jgi:hypothetical protein